MQTTSKRFWAGSIAIASMVGTLGIGSSDMSNDRVLSSNNFAQRSQGQTTIFRGSGRMLGEERATDADIRGSGRVIAENPTTETDIRGSGRAVEPDDRGSGRLLTTLLPKSTVTMTINDDRGSGRLIAGLPHQHNDDDLAFRGSGRAVPTSA